jgi:hypothetical protein
MLFVIRGDRIPNADCLIMKTPVIPRRGFLSAGQPGLRKCCASTRFEAIGSQRQ